jgi:hypothetical protein
VKILFLFHMPQVRSDPKERGVVKAEKAARVSKEQQQTTWLEESGGGGSQLIPPHEF